MPILPLLGHEPLRRRLAEAVARGALPSSLLLQGPRGVGKQRLALWLGQLLLCTGAAEARPCGQCQSCRYVGTLAHPDLHWYFPRPRLKDADASPEEVRDDFREALGERARAHGLYAPPAGTEALYVATVRAVVQSAAVRPALGRRKVFVIGDAERMVPQEGAEAAANAFLKLLEEPPADTTIVLTSSEPGALLPTIRSRVAAVRVPRVADEVVRAFLALPEVRAASPKGGASDDERVIAAAGAPGALLAEGGWTEAMEHARRFIDAATGERPAQLKLALQQGVARARGGFTDVLEALTVLLHERVRSAATRDDEARAVGAARAIEAVERAREMASGNVNPQLVSIALLRELQSRLR